MGRRADHPAAAWVLAAAAFAVAAAGARPYAGSWNDGSRLATVESLVERGTFAIDDSVFVAPPPALIARGTPPYAPGSPANTTGTFDKLLIGGHFYSDKPAVISVLLAAAYRPLVWLGVPPPSARPDVFCFLMTVLASATSYAAAVGCMWAVGRRVGLAPALRLGWLAAFALCTVAPAYSRHVNNHVMHLAVLAGTCALLARAVARGGVTTPTAAGLGLLAGLGFNLDLGSGPLLVAIVGSLVVWRTRRAGPAVAFAAAAVPWVAAGMWVNYSIGGVLKPMNMVPEYSQWPGCPFTPKNMTGFVRYGPLDQLRYLACMLVGSPGFVTHNLPLWLAAAGWGVLRRPFAGRAELLAALAWCGATWLMYGVLSNNYSGKSLSVRWFVPFLAPGFWLLAVALRDRPRLRPPFAALAAWGAVLGGAMWAAGPSPMRAVPLLAPVVGGAAVTWWLVARRAARAAEVAVPAAAPEVARRAA